MTQPVEPVHHDPVWRDRANFILATAIDPAGTEVGTEQLWGRRLDSRLFELCCIPFFAYDLALGDVVRTDERYMVQAVVRPSGRYVFRVHFGQTTHPWQEVCAQLVESGALMEWWSPTMVAVDARDQNHAQVIADFLQEQENLGHLIFETGKTA